MEGMEIICLVMILLIALLAALVLLMLRAIAIWNINLDSYKQWNAEVLGTLSQRIALNERRQSITEERIYQ